MASDFKLSDCYVKPHSQPCWDCVNAYGGCEWSKSFQPVPGWDAAPVRNVLTYRKNKTRIINTFRIRYCPKFVQEEPHGQAGD